MQATDKASAMTGDMRELMLGAALGDAVLSLHGDALAFELSRIAKAVVGTLDASYFCGRSQVAPELNAIRKQVSAEAFYVLSGKSGAYTDSDLMKLAYLADVTGKLFSSKAKLDNTLSESKSAQFVQTQILDQIHESVITMDLAGFILSWNAGAEALFGYSAQEAIGQNVIFLYAEEEADELRQFDPFLEHGGRNMEVRRRKKSGEVFWANLSLSPLCDETSQEIGLIGYLSDITDKKRAEERINHLAYYDPLTDLPNRTLFKKLIDKAFLQSQRDNAICALLFIDLNRFKPINDTFGHQTGDALLAQVAERLRLALRDNDVIARLGGDEFAIGLVGINQEFHAGLVAQKLLSVLDQIFSINGEELRIGASIGISVYPQDGTEAHELLQKADVAMMKAKRHIDRASGSYAFYNLEMNRTIAGRLHLESGLRRALHHDEFFLQYQPKVDIGSGQIVGAEALIRWRHPKKGLVSPTEFIAVAEETALILHIDDWVLEAVCAQARKWQDHGVQPFRIAVNISAKEFTSVLPGRIRRALASHQLTSRWLELEITESMLMHSAESVINIMDEISGMGVTLSLDDFGTGYSSLSYLKRFPITTLKIDRSFIQGIPGDKDDCAIAGAIISVAKQLRHKVIAEGVESAAQFAFLKKEGCDEMQGYLFSRPVDADQFSRMVMQNFCFNVV